MRKLLLAHAMIYLALGSGCALLESVDDPVYPEDAATDTEDNDTLVSDVDVDSSLEAEPDTSTDDSGMAADSDDDTGVEDADATVGDVLDASDSALDTFTPDTTVVDTGSDTKDVGIDSGADTKDSGADTKDAAMDTAPICTSGSYSCAGNDLRQCKTDGSGYNTIVTCPAGTCSAASARCTFCTAGALSCSGAQPTKCNTLGSAYAANGAACVAPQTCGGGGTTGVCGCTPTPTATLCAGKDCGSVSNGCGGMVSCGSCTAPHTCGGGGTANKCGGCGGTLPGPTMVNAGTYCIDSTEVTQAQYSAFVTAKGSDLSGQPATCGFNTSYAPATDAGCSTAGTPSRPANCVDWCDASMYCKWAGKRLCGRIGGGSNAYLEPADATKDQWFAACTSPSNYTFPYGNAYIGFCYTPNDTSTSSVPVNVATYPSCTGTAAPYTSIFDMSGNVSEWEDSCGNLSGTWYCHSRGGSFIDPHASVQCNDESAWPLDITAKWLGFRCCAD